MKGDPEFVILKYSTWLDAVKFEDKILGSIVRQYLRPTNAFVPESPLQYNVDELVEGSFTDFVVGSCSSELRDTNASLQSVAGFTLRGSATDTVHLQGKFIRYKRLQQHDRFWLQLSQDEAVRASVPAWMSTFNSRAKPVCLVVGIMICEDVDVSFAGKQSIEREGNVQLPLGMITLAAGVPNPLGNTGNPQAHLSDSSNKATIFKAKSGNSRIFALELRKVTTAFLRRRELRLKDDGPDVDNGRLLGNSDDEDEEEEDDDDELVLEDISIEDFAEMDE
jgi:hypothetical protein